ncbi:hypothetical protein C0Q70_21393 [Pomacea canaliculata]|uniref:Uncharacterized protein n=1 Tax=Pomacea canaliculata TaxID=400727 RepID=A0A2T7NCD9_POMCA|nr:uncharacterized protein LOC112555866 [Pomacea canaliculata]PVD18840.1 hypothetical protein C0Q70_21393 [Pomacea canaliculata]
MEPRPLICGHLQLRQSYQLTDNCDEAEITRVGDDAPQPVKNKLRQVLLRKPGEIEFMVVSETGLILTMESISSLDDPAARFLKRDYTLKEDGQYAATFMNMKTLTYVAVNQESQVHLCELSGDPKSCRHPCLFIMQDTGTTRLLPTVTPGKYLGYRGSTVEVTDDISSFNMQPYSTDTQVADHPHSSSEDLAMVADYHVH